MLMIKKIILYVIIVLVVILGLSCLYVVQEDEVAVVKSFGEIKSVVINSEDYDMVKESLANTPKGEAISIINSKGLHVKIPFVQTVEKYTSKYLTYKSTQETINTADDRQIDIQMYAQYRVVDPAKFNMAVGSKSNANNKMDVSVYPVVIQSANALTFNEFFYQDSIENMIDNKITELNENLLKDFGIYAVDIGINRKNFPFANQQSIEEKMSKEIDKESQKLRAEGDSSYTKSKATTDRERKEILAEAVEKAATVKAAADQEALKIYQQSLQKDLGFYKFIKRMETYKAMKNTTIFLDKDNAFLNNIEGY